ncbi:MAG: hypothetical protein KAU31_09375 [Spirochaetaceae bacterium]|nr:hypothetical protein [Spirochaetaceae bacterium]
MNKSRKNRGIPMVLVMVLFGAALAVAQSDGTIQTDDDSLFGSSDDLFSQPLVTDVVESETNIATMLLTSEAVQIGGRYAMSVQSSFVWNDIATVAESIFEPDTTSLSTSLSTQLFFDARPDEDFRVFGKMTASSPFATDADRDLQDVFHVEELFSDFNWDDSVFFRGGKQTMNWGVGYFYSPADLLSISEIDPEDPEAEREGPVALKANLPIDVHNLYFYALPTFADVPLDVGVAIKGELVVGGAEITAGAIYQRDIAPAGMITVTTNTGDFDLYAEGVVSYGSNRTYVEESATAPLGVAVYSRTDEIFLAATAGVSWNYSLDDDESSILVTSQYLYNGEGYSDPTVLSDNRAGIAALIGAGNLTAGDIQNSGRHYTATQLSWRDIFGSGVNGGVFWMQNYSDMSARITPSLSTTLFDAVTLSLQTPITAGDADDELSPLGNTLSVSLNASLGSGSF